MGPRGLALVSWREGGLVGLRPGCTRVLGLQLQAAHNH